MAAEAARRFVSRGGEKLDGALSAFGADVTGLRALDAGASTGGFTDCLLQRGAREVVAVDVAYGQLAWSLRNDPRVRVVERTNVRALTLEQVGDPADVVVADLSFISLRTVAGALLGLTAREGELFLMVKPQFELPKGEVPHGGVVSDHDAWVRAMRVVADDYRARGSVLLDATPSPLTGPKGNREFFLRIGRAGRDAGDVVLERAAEGAP